jgi:hypothetical protein
MEGYWRISEQYYGSEEYFGGVAKLYRNILMSHTTDAHVDQDELITIIYYAIEEADFLNSYVYPVFSDIENIVLASNETSYSQIHVLFEESDVIGKDDFRKTLLSKEEFLKDFKRNPEKYGKVTEELKNPYQLMKRSWNRTMERRNAFLNHCEMLAVFEEFLRTRKEPEMENMMKDMYTQGKGFPEFPDSKSAFENFRNSLGEFMFFLYNPYSQNTESKMGEVFEIYEEYKRGEFKTAELNERLKALKAAEKHHPLPIEKIDSHLNPEELKTIFVHPESAEPAQFSYLAFNNTSLPFMAVGLKFRSIGEFVNFAMLDEFLGLGRDEAYRQRDLPGVVEHIRRSFENHVACAIRDSIAVHMKEITSSEIKTSSIRDTSLDENRISKFFDDFLTFSLSKAAPIKKKVEINDGETIRWIEKRKNQLIDIYDVVKARSIHPENLKKVTSLYNLWSLIMKLPRAEIIFTISTKPQPKLNQLAEEYVLGELSFILSNGFDLKKLVSDNGKTIVSLFPDFSEEETLATVKKISLLLEPYVLQEDSTKVASILISNLEEANELNIWGFAKRVPEIMRRLKLFYELHRVYDNEEF